MNKSKICLFAGYDTEGIIDSYVVSYVKELSKYCDVYYLADSDISRDELSKLYPYVKQAWAYRHGEYDFGSYARLIVNYVGWDVINTYSDLLLVNDSCYLIRSLEEVFSDMDSRRVDWWGLQATKGISKTRYKLNNLYKNKIPLDLIRDKYVDTYENEYFYDFLIGSYFLSFSKKVFNSPIFKSFFNNIEKEKNKLNIIRKYEIGLTRILIKSGFSFDTYMNSLYPFHPIFTHVYFDMVEEGFPLLKRYFLTQNHYSVPNLYEWEIKLRHTCPDLNVNDINLNLNRVCSSQHLYEKLHIKGERKFPYLKYILKSIIKRVRYIRVVNQIFVKLKFKKRISIAKSLYNRLNPVFQLKDKFTYKDDHLWIFPTCAYDDSLTGNDLAVFYEVKDNEEIKKIILYRHNPVDINGKNISQFQIDSREAEKSILKSGVIFIKHNPFVNTKRPINGKLRKVICLWHGIPLKRIGCASLDFQNKLKRIKKIHEDYHSVICSSEIDRLAMTAAFQPLDFNQVWLTGLPRADFVLKPIPELPNSIQVEIEKLNSILSGKKLIFFCPTFKNGQGASYYEFSNQEINQLGKWLDKNNAVLGIREHMAARGSYYYNNFSKLNPLDLSSNNIVNIEAIYRVASILITDYSSAYIDFMLTSKPIISFAYDRESYLNEERGLFYNFESAIPGPVCDNFASLMNELDKFSEFGKLISDNEYSNIKRMFYTFIDDNNAKRLVSKLFYH